MTNRALSLARYLNTGPRTLRVLTLSLLLAALGALAAIGPDQAHADGNCASHHPYKVTDGHGHDGDGDGVGCEANPRWPSSGSSRVSSGGNGHSTCADHYPYKVTDGHGHDGDGDGVGCESNPLWPPGSNSSSASTGSQSSGYDRDNWSYDSSAARARLGCTSNEHVDHIVALKEAYDSGGSAWTFQRKREFANDPLNQWCLAASVNMSKSDSDLAEWSGGTCEQRKFIAERTRQVKAKYGLSIDPAERTANTAALAATCTAVTSTTITNLAAGLSSTSPGLRTWTSTRLTTAAQLFAALTAAGNIQTLWRWNGSAWIGYAEAGSDPIPGAFDFVIRANDRLYIGN